MPEWTRPLSMKGKHVGGCFTHTLSMILFSGPCMLYLCPHCPSMVRVRFSRREACNYCLPAFGSTAEVLSAKLVLVAASDVLLTMNTGLLSCGGTTGKGLGWHFGEGS